MATTRRTTKSSTRSGNGSKKDAASSPERPKATRPRAAGGKTSGAAPRKRPAKGSGKAAPGAPRKPRKAPATSPRVAGAKRAPARPDSVSARESAREALARKLALLVADAALDRKAESVEVIDIRGRVDYADYLVVMSGRSDRHVVAVAQGIEQALDAKGHKCLGVEGLPQGHWVLMDYGDVIGHVFLKDRRSYYDLEGLWLDADRVPFHDGSPAAAAAR